MQRVTDFQRNVLHWRFAEIKRFYFGGNSRDYDDSLCFNTFTELNWKQRLHFFRMRFEAASYWIKLKIEITFQP